MFSPNLGRWIQEDPIGFQADDENLYRYIGNDPTSGVDPNGLQPPPFGPRGEPGEGAFRAGMALGGPKNVAAVGPGPLQSVGEGPQTGFSGVKFTRFYAYWGVGLYLDEATLTKLKDAGGGFVVSRRKITLYTGFLNDDNTSETAWFIDPVNFKDGKLEPNDDFSSSPSGPRSMEGGKICTAYFSIINTPDGIPSKSGEITAELSYRVYAGSPTKEIFAKFPKTGAPKTGQRIGFDEYVHKNWAVSEPSIPGRPLMEGHLSAKITWAEGEIHSFTSPDTGIPSGPQRKGRSAYFSDYWKYDHTTSSWGRVIRNR